MIINGIKILSPTHLEEVISTLSEINKIALRDSYYKELEKITSKINDKIKFFQSVAPELLRELYTANTISGITVQQSDQMFDDYADVLNRIKEGAFPTAYYRLTQKTPSGFVTQDLIDTWKGKIMRYLV